MRIFCALRHSIHPAQYYGGLWSANFYPALREMGHEIVESQTDLLSTSRFMDIPCNFTREELGARARTTEEILKEVRSAQRVGPVDLFLSYFYHAHFDPAGFDELRRLGVPSVNFYCNSVHQFDLVAAVSAKADFAWHAERNARQAYLDAGARPVWVQMAADPKVYRPILGSNRVPRACFVGRRYADRDRWMAQLVRSGVPIEIYGPGWEIAAPSPDSGAEEFQTTYLGRRRIVAGSRASYLAAARDSIRQEGLFSGVLRIAQQWSYRRQTRALTSILASSVRGQATEIASVFARHELCLNFSNVWSDGRSGSRLIPHVRLRDFEAPMSRACYLTGHTDEIAEFYDVGHEIETYHSQEELVDKARFYLQHTDSAEKIREAGYRRARRDHTWTRRFEELFQKIGLPASACVR